MEWMFIKMLLSLVAVLGLMFGLAFLVKKYVLKGNGRSSAVVGIDILGQRTLQPKRTVMVLKVLDKILVVGMTDHGMQTLTEFDERDLPDVTGQASAAGTRGRADGGPQLPVAAVHRTFAGHLQQYIQNLVQR